MPARRAGDSAGDGGEERVGQRQRQDARCHRGAGEPGDWPTSQFPVHEEVVVERQSEDRLEQDRDHHGLHDERLPEEPGVQGADIRTPLAGRLAQLVERLPYKQEVARSSRAPFHPRGSAPEAERLSGLQRIGVSRERAFAASGNAPSMASTSAVHGQLSAGPASLIGGGAARHARAAPVGFRPASNGSRRWSTDHAPVRVVLL